VTFDVEKGEAALAIAHGKIERLIRRKFFYDELLDGCG
jgi:hypothetical protein